MNEDALYGFSGTARLFPLSNVVLFPHVIQGLHIFETRYRQMTADALAGDGLIAIVMLKEGEDEEEPVPAIEAVGCLGRIVWHEELPDGRYNLRLGGLSRVRIIQELQSESLYRTARVAALADDAPTDFAALTKYRHDLAGVVLPRFAEDSAARNQIQELFDGDLPLGPVCDILSFALPLTSQLKQALLAETSVVQRAVALVDALRVAAARAGRPFPPPFSSN
jgi:Lon protease-like protein